MMLVLDADAVHAALSWPYLVAELQAARAGDPLVAALLSIARGSLPA